MTRLGETFVDFFLLYWNSYFAQLNVFSTPTFSLKNSICVLCLLAMHTFLVDYFLAVRMFLLFSFLWNFFLRPVCVIILYANCTLWIFSCQKNYRIGYIYIYIYIQKQDDQRERTYSSSVRIRDVALKTCRRRLTIGRSGERGSGISVLAARHDDDEYIYIYIYINYYLLKYTHALLSMAYPFSCFFVRKPSF